MLTRTFFFVILFLILFLNSRITPKAGAVLGEKVDFLGPTTTLETKSNFAEEEAVITSSIPYKIEYSDNKEKETDYEAVVKTGVKGEKNEIYGVTYWFGKPIYRVLRKTEVRQPINEIIERGTKVSWKETMVNGTNLKYWKKLNVWATSYDPYCRGCGGLTYSGTAVALGTCAIDPKVIRLGSKFYVPGYGLCRAEDIGGAIKGKKVDLGFPIIKEGWWSARFVDIYLLDGEPKTL